MILPIHLTDLIVFVGYLLFVVVLGCLVGRGQKTLSGYLLGDRNLPWWAILGSIVATETSTVTFLSVPGIAYAQGGDLRFLQLTIGYIIGRILIALFMIPMYFSGNLFTAYEILEQRFGLVVKRTASIIFLCARNAGDAMRLFLTALVIKEMFDASLPACILVIGILTIAYTLFGGMKAVVWNDCVQLVVYLVGGALIAVEIVQRISGGVSEITQFAQQTGRFQIFDFSMNLTDPYTFWAGLIGGMVLTMGTHGVDQMLVQRYLAARSQNDAKLALIVSGIVVCLQFAFFLLIGVALACFTAANGDQWLKNDRALANFIVHEMPQGVGLVGIIMAGVFSAAMSTLSSSLNSSATVVVNDFLTHEKSDAKRLLSFSKWLTVCFGVIQIVIAIAAGNQDSSVVTQVLGIAGLTVGALLGLFALSRTGVSPSAAIVGLTGGFLILLYTWRFTPIAWPWYALIGSLSTFVVGAVAGTLLRKKQL